MKYIPIAPLILVATLIVGCTEMSRPEHAANAAMIAADDGRPDDIVDDFDRALGR